MTRWIAGALDPERQIDRSRLARALAPRPAETLELGALRITYTGPPPRATDPLCLLAGHIDNLAHVAGEQEPGAVDEALATAYARWGAQLPARLRGDFLLLVWDPRRGEGLLARDQMGARSLYLHEGNAALCFAGEVRHLLALLPRRPEPDAAGVAHWVTAWPRPDEGTLYAGVRRLPAGCLLRLRPGGGAQRQRYWRPTFVEPARIDARERTEGLRGALATAVGRRVGTDGATAVLLSGGLDSATVAALAAARAPGRVSALSGVFPEHRDADESQLIACLRAALELDGPTAQVRAGGIVASGLEYVREWDLPLLSWGDFWTLPLLRAASAAGVQTVLGGDGGDELFDTRAYLLADAARSPLRLLRLARELPGAGDHPGRVALLRAAWRFAFAAGLPYGLHAAVQRRLTPRSLPSWLRAPARQRLTESADPLAWRRLEGPRWWAQGAHALTHGIEQAGVLELHRHRADTAGLQARHPLLDLDLVQFVLRQDPSSSFDRHRNRPALRAAAAGLLPDHVRLRAGKARFDSLVIDALTVADAHALRSLLCDPAAELGAWVDIGAVEQLIRRPPPGAAERLRWLQHLWRLCTAECWLRRQAGTSPDDLAGALGATPARVLLFSALTARDAHLDSLPSVNSAS